MIKILHQEQCKDWYTLHLEFTPFGKSKIGDKQKFKSEKQAMNYYEESKRQVFLSNFERFIVVSEQYCPTEKQRTSIERLYAANKYFNETKDLTLQKICSMTIGVQNHLMCILPPGKNPDYDTYFGQVNSLIKFCKGETKGGD